jgi:hypothetical protein
MRMSQRFVSLPAPTNVVGAFKNIGLIVILVYRNIGNQPSRQPILFI